MHAVTSDLYFLHAENVSCLGIILKTQKISFDMWELHFHGALWSAGCLTTNYRHTCRPSGKSEPISVFWGQYTIVINFQS